MIVLYPECSKWEISYIKNDLLNEEQILSISDKIKTINYYFYNNIPLVSDIEEHIKKDEDKNIVLVFSRTPLITNIEIGKCDRLASPIDFTTESMIRSDDEHLPCSLSVRKLFSMLETSWAPRCKPKINCSVAEPFSSKRISSAHVRSLLLGSRSKF